jgi:Arc/MetJ-type ribon-helix-helix transcriptional regulator
LEATEKISVRVPLSLLAFLDDQAKAKRARGQRSDRSDQVTVSILTRKLALMSPEDQAAAIRQARTMAGKMPPPSQHVQGDFLANAESGTANAEEPEKLNVEDWEEIEVMGSGRVE